MVLDESVSWDEQSRELLLTCDAGDKITWLDARAERMLGIGAGVDFLSIVVPGTEAKARELLARARHKALSGWEVPVLVGSKPATACFSAKPGAAAGSLHLHASVMPDGYGQVIEQLTQSMHEVTSLNRQIARQKKELEQKHQELTRAYQELDESNRGVLTLHAELADKADILKRAADVKSRVVANVSHEFRTPLHTILGLSKLLLNSSDGPLTSEQEKQVQFIRSSAEELSSLVNDMLDLSKAESGTAILRSGTFTAEDFFAALRGQLRPLATTKDVALIFEEPPPGVVFDTDQSKLAQVLRNLVSNALKFTERGEVRVSLTVQGGFAAFRVQDTGVGIAPQHHERVFEEFGQVENALQARVKGTGLGLPLSRKLADLLGGTLTVESALGRGSTFTLTIPVSHPEVRELVRIETQQLDPTKAPVLVVEDDRKTIFIYDKYLSMAGFQVVPARNVDDARRLLSTMQPAAIVLDIMLEGESSWGFLGELKRDEKTRDIPVLVVTITNKEQKARALGADEFWLKPVDQSQLLRKLRTISKPRAPARVLVIDDDDKARYLLRKFLETSPYELLEAGSGPEGIRCAREQRPHVILLDFLLIDMTAFDVLDELKADPRTRGIPVVIVTSHVLGREEKQRLAAETEAIVSKESLSRELAINRIRDALQKAGVGPRFHGGDSE